ncbi:MAG: DUF5723 family protein [Bacteroidales bacterium]|nr:DUF5723 family protein [Bacteroidales bacterium]
MRNKIYSIGILVKSSLLVFVVLMMMQQHALAQPLVSKYFLNEMSGNNKINAAFVPEYGYYSLPVLGQFGGSIHSTSGLSDFLFPLNGKYALFMNKAVDANDFLSRLDPNTTINQTLQFDILSFGFFTKRNSFWSFGIGYRENLHLNLPYDFFAMAKKGMSSSSSLYDLKSIRMEQNNIADVTLGYSRKIGSKFRVGLNAKLLVGLTSARIKYEKFDVLFDQNQFKVDATGDAVLISDAISFPLDEKGNFKFGDYNLNTSKIKPAGYGAAFDLGITYNPIKKLTISASVNDLGSLKWNSAAVKHGVAAGGVVFAGFNDIDATNVDIQAQLDQMKEDAKGLMQFKETPVTESYTYDLPTITRVGAEYSLFGNPKHDISVGVMYQNYSSKLYSNQEMVGALNLRPLSWLMVSGTAAMLTKDYNRYGFALSFSPCWFNFYIASDFVTPNVNHQFIPIDAFNLNFETGFSIPFGKSRRKVAKAPAVLLPPPPPPAPVEMPIAPIDSMTVVPVDDSLAAPAIPDTLVIAPVDSALMVVGDSLSKDTTSVKAVMDTLNQVVPVVDQIAVVPLVVELAAPTLKTPQSVTTIAATKPKATVKKGKATTKKTTKTTARKPTSKKTTVKK